MSMSASPEPRYLTDLHWFRKLSAFSPAEQKVLMALSHAKYKWRTRHRLAAVTGLPGKELDSTLAGLLAKQLVRPSLSKNKNIIFALKERIG